MKNILDIMAVAGVVLITYGSWCIYPPLVYIVPGAALLSLGLYGANKWAS